MKEDQLYIGKIERIIESKRGLIGQLRPLYSYDQYGWYPLNRDDIHTLFPNRGIVSLYDLTNDMVEGTLWQFCIKKQLYNQDDPYHDAFEAINTYLLEEVLDVRNNGGEDGIRKKVTVEGIWLPYPPKGRVYLWVEETLWIGPVRLVFLAQTDRWILDAEEQKDPLPCIQPARTENIIHLEEGRTFTLPDKTSKRLGMVDWASDDVVLSRVLRRLPHVDAVYAKDLGLTEKAITHLVERLEVGVPTNKMLETQRLRRAKAILERLYENKEIVEKVLPSLLTLDNISTTIDEAVEQARQRTIEKIREEASQHIEDLSLQSQAIQTELISLQQTVTEKQNELASLKHCIAEQHLQLHTQLDELEATFNQHLSELLNSPGKVLSEIAIFRAVMNHSSFPQHSSSPIRESDHQQTKERTIPLPSWKHTQLTYTTIPDFSTFRKDVRQIFRQRGITMKLASILHCAFLTGAMPTLVGENAFEVLEAYASRVACNRLLWIPISPTTFEPGDLLGKVDPGTRRFVPHPGGLLDLLLHAQTTDDLYLVVLDGINRAALDAYLMPILACYKDAWNDCTRRTLPLLHGYTVDDTDPYALISHLAWPPNVLLAGILTQGVTAIAPPLPFWSSAIMLHLEQFDDNIIAPVTDSELTDQVISSTVPQILWQNWRKQQSDSDSSACTEFLHSVLEKGFSLGSGAKKLSLQLYRASQVWGVDEESAITNVISHVLIPAAISSNQVDVLLNILASQQRATDQLGTSIQLAKQVLI